MKRIFQLLIAVGFALTVRAADITAPGGNTFYSIPAVLTTSTNFPGFNVWQTNGNNIAFVSATFTNNSGIAAQLSEALLMGLPGGPTNVVAASGQGTLTSLTGVQSLSAMLSNTAYYCFTNTSTSGNTPGVGPYSFQTGFAGNGQTIVSSSDITVSGNSLSISPTSPTLATATSATNLAAAGVVTKLAFGTNDFYIAPRGTNGATGISSGDPFNNWTNVPNGGSCTLHVSSGIYTSAPVSLHDVRIIGDGWSTVSIYATNSLGATGLLQLTNAEMSGVTAGSPSNQPANVPLSLFGWWNIHDNRFYSDLDIVSPSTGAMISNIPNFFVRNEIVSGNDVFFINTVDTSTVWFTDNHVTGPASAWNGSTERVFVINQHTALISVFFERNTISLSSPVANGQYYAFGSKSTAGGTNGVFCTIDGNSFNLVGGAAVEDLTNSCGSMYVGQNSYYGNVTNYGSGLSNWFWGANQTINVASNEFAYISNNQTNWWFPGGNAGTGSWP